MNIVIRILAGLLIGAGIGFGANYLCHLTGGACPLMSNRLTAIVIWALIGGLIGASLR